MFDGDGAFAQRGSGGQLIIDLPGRNEKERCEAFDAQSLVVIEAYVDEGPTLKRFRPRAQGRASQILKRTSHITVVVAPVEKKERAR